MVRPSSSATAKGGFSNGMGIRPPPKACEHLTRRAASLGCSLLPGRPGGIDQSGFHFLLCGSPSFGSSALATEYGGRPSIPSPRSGAPLDARSEVFIEVHLHLFDGLAGGLRVRPDLTPGSISSATRLSRAGRMPQKLDLGWPTRPHR